MIGWVCSANFGRKREMAVRRPMRRWTSLTLVGLRILMIALHFSRFASMPCWVSMNLRNLPQSTPNTHLSGLRRIMWRRLLRGLEHAGDGSEI